MASPGVQSLESAPASAETRTGLEPWVLADLAQAPAPTGLQWAKVVGPVEIVLGLSLGGGEFLLGPTAFVRYGLSLLWITLVAVFFQTIFNTDSCATPWPRASPCLRVHAHAPGARVLGVAVCGDVPPAGGLAVFSGIVGGSDLLSRHQAHICDAGRCDPHLSARHRDVSALHFPADARRCIERTLELLNWVMVVCILGGFLALRICLVPGSTWAAAAVGFFGFDLPR